MKMSERLKTMVHDFKVDPFYNIFQFVSLFLVGTLLYGFVLSFIQTFLK
jgi:hypothetical protein